MLILIHIIRLKKLNLLKKILMQKISDQFLIHLFLPIVLLAIVFYGFNSVYFPYSKLEKLPDYYYSNIYNFRFASRDILVWFSEKFHVFFNQLNPSQKTFALKYGTAFYHSFFLFNLFFFILSSIIITRIFKLTAFSNVIEKFKILLHILFLLLIAISNYVLTPYDNPAIFLFLLTVLFSIQYFENQKFSQLITLSILIFIATLNRETSSLNIAFLGALIWSKNIFEKVELQNFFKVISLPVIAFLLAYISVRIFVKSNDATISEGIYLVQNFTKTNNILGVLFFIIFIRIAYLIKNTTENSNKISKFLLLSSPYLLMILMVGILWEIRLFIPIIFGLIFLSQMNFEKNE